MAAPVLFVPSSGTFAAELAARTALTTGNVYWKVEVDDDVDGSYTDYTAFLSGNQVSVGGKGSIFRKAVSSTASFRLRNTPVTWVEGDLAGVPVKISVKIGASEYIQVFFGYVDPRGCSRVKSSFLEDVIDVEVNDPLQSRALSRKADRQELYTNFTICDTVSTGSSLAHALATKLGLTIPGDLDFVDIPYLKDYVFVPADSSYGTELQDLATQHSALLGFRYDGKLRLVVWSEADWNSPTPEYTFDSTNVHSFSARGTDIVCNRAKTEFENYQLLAAGLKIYKCLQDYDEATRENAIIVGAGQYWPGGADGESVARLEYEANGERFPLGIGLITPTIGTTNASDIWCSGGTLSLESFNGASGINPAKTKQNADSSEIILKNNTGSPITIKGFSVRGTPVRILSKVIVQHEPAGLDEWEIVEQTLPGRYAVSKDQAEITCQRWVAFGQVTRKQYEAVVDFTPTIQAGAIVTFNPTAEVNMLAVVESYQHTSAGPHTRTRTKVTLVEHTSFSAAAGASDGTYRVVGERPHELIAEIVSDLADRVTYTELQDGYTAGGGTTVPVTPTISQAKGVFKGAILQWDRQLDLTNFSHYELRVSSDDATWYSLKFDLTDWKDTLGAVTSWPSEFLSHPVPNDTSDPENVVGRTLYYQVRRVTRAASASAWSASATVTTSPVDTGDYAANSIGVNVLQAGIITAREMSFADDGGGSVLEGWDPVPDGAELFDLRQPDCVSSLQRGPTTKEIVYLPGKLYDQAGNAYDNLWSRFTGLGTIGAFKATTNLVASPEDLTTASWGLDSASAPSLSSYYFQGRRFTKLSGNNSQKYARVYQSATPAAAKNAFTVTFKKGASSEADSATYFNIVIFDSAWTNLRCEVYVPWSKSGAYCPSGTPKGMVVSEKWYGDVVEIQCVTDTCLAVAGYFEVGMVKTATNATSSDYCYITAVQYEQSTYPTPYTPTSRAQGGVFYSASCPTAGAIETWVRPWGSYTTTYLLWQWGNEAGQKVQIYYSGGAAKWVGLLYKDGTHYTQKTSSAYATDAEFRSWHHLKLAWDLSAGTLSLYVDGVLQTGDSSVNTGAGASLEPTLAIGVTTSLTSPMDAQFEDFLIWPAADTSVTHVGTLPTTTGAELIDRGDCESATPPSFTGETANAKTNATFARDNAQAHGGSYSYKVTLTTGGSWGYVVLPDNANTNDLHGIAPGTAYQIDLWMKIPSGAIQASEIYCTFTDYYGGAWHDVTVQPAALYDQWQKITVVKRAYPFATGCYFQFSIKNTASSSEYFHVDDITMHALTEITGSVPWFDPSEVVNAVQTVRINRSGIRLHNTSLTITDDKNRLIDISNRTGLLARDAAGAIIHDIPTVPVLAGAYPMSHTYWSAYNDAAYTLVNINNPTALTVGAWVTGVQALSLGNSRVGGAKFKIWMYGSGVANTVARGKVWLRPNGSTWSVASTNMTPNVGQELTLNGAYVLNVANVWMIDCPLPANLQFDYYITLTPSASTWTFVIQQVAVMI